MRKYIKEIQGRIEYTTEFKVKTAKDVRERMDAVMAERGEGLVMKHPMSQYVLNGRNSDWIKVRGGFLVRDLFDEMQSKVKPEYMVCVRIHMRARC